MARQEIPREAWNDVDVDTLTPACKKLYKALKEANAAASERRATFNEAFEKAIRALPDVVTDEQSVVIGHQFGKLSFAVTDEPPKVKGGKNKTKFSFS